MRGVVEKIAFTQGGAGNQWTTISGVRYATFWDCRTTDWGVGDTVEFERRDAALWHNHPPIPHATSIRRVASDTAEGLLSEIHKGDSLEVREPTVGKWYCACNYVEDLDSASGVREDHGILAEYVGGGEFHDGDSDETRSMRAADFLIEQN